MFDLLFEIVCGKKYKTMIITENCGVLYGIPCKDDSGCSAVYSEQTKLSDITASFDTYEGDYEQEGIMITKDKDKYTIKHVCYNSTFAYWE